MTSQTPENVYSLGIDPNYIQAGELLAKLISKLMGLIHDEESKAKPDGGLLASYQRDVAFYFEELRTYKELSGDVLADAVEHYRTALESV